jgi:hypothetical protein
MRIFLLRGTINIAPHFNVREAYAVGFVPKRLGVSIGQIPVMGEEDPYHHLLEYKGPASLIAHIFNYLCVTVSLAAVAEPSHMLILPRPTLL